MTNEVITIEVRGALRVFRTALLVLAFLVLIPKGWAEEELPRLPKGPLLLTSITPDQLSADYWINRLPSPDQPLRTPEEIKALNDDIHREIKNRVDLFKMESVKAGKPVRDQIKLEYSTVSGRVLFGVGNHRIQKNLFEEDIKPLMQWEKVPDKISIKWGAAIRPASVRALPSDVKMLEEVGDIEFDQLQFTFIKLWTPVAVLHESKDGVWYYLQAPYARGWVKAKDIALFPSRAELEKFTKPDDFLVVIGESLPLYLDSALQTTAQKPSMGTVLPVAEKMENAYVVWRPVRNADGTVLLRKAYVDLKSDVSVGFLPYTQRKVIEQAFKLLASRYGWGGMYGGRDCSAFTQDIFLTFGIDMPRGSKDQTFTGTQIDHFEYKGDKRRKIRSLRFATPGITLMRMPHHQMLYLGEIHGQFYAIHCTWAQRVSMTSDEKNRINQVVVSDLTLNGHSYLGSLFDRIISMSEVN